VTTVLMQEAKRVSGSHPPNTQSSPSIWRDDTLRTIERHLAAFIGPVARLHVRSASAHATDFGQLCAILAEKLDTDAARSSFLKETRKLGHNAISDVVTPPAAQPGSTATPASGSRLNAPLAPEIVELAARGLAHYIGPIANVLARKAAAVARDERHLYLLLSAHLSGVDRDAYLNRGQRRNH
jgi:serine/threonine-protein kinase